MKLRLYKEPYRDPMKPGVVRLLFEGIQSPEDQKDKFDDFYLYVWIDTGGVLKSFQAVLDDLLVFEVKMPSVISFGQISKEPFNRTVKINKSSQKRKRMIRIMSNLRNEYFPDLLKRAGEIAREENIVPVELSREEKMAFEKLMKENV
ncbi:MAG: hypothetical protein GF401_15635 [Chitinivibrionales bacterium]|nr:hypothetical protein [Chitinivibrionales bacterium]